jgi:LPXTG-motif cell wall-anchored protein
MAVAEKERVNIPMWVGVGAIVAGTLLLLMRRKIL